MRVQHEEDFLREMNTSSVFNIACFFKFSLSLAIRGLLEKYPKIFLAKTWWISMKRACIRRLESSYAGVNFSPSVNHVS